MARPPSSSSQYLITVYPKSVLEVLVDRHPDLRPTFLGHILDAFLQTMSDQKHQPGVTLQANILSQKRSPSLVWTQIVDQTHHNTHADENRRTDNAANAVALALVDTVLGKSALGLSQTGDRIDFYLTGRSDERLIFNDVERLEVSEIRAESRSNSLKRRVSEKVDRLNAVGGPGHDEKSIVCVVEFSKPKAELVKV